MTREITLIVAAVIIMLGVGVIQASTVEIREYLLGDIDGFVYNGAGSTDDVYVDPDWLSWGQGYSVPINGFDVFENEQWVLFSFLYDLAVGEEVIDATLTIAMRSISPDFSYHALILASESIHTRPSFTELNWEPIPETETAVRSVSLDNVANDDLIPHLQNLQNGIFNVAINRDIAVDYAILTTEVVPEPTSFLLFGLGGVMLRKRR